MLERPENRVDGAIEVEQEICKSMRMSENASTIGHLTAGSSPLLRQAPIMLPFSPG